MKQHLEKIKNAWRAFVNQNEIDYHINATIAESWMRCKELKVDHMNGHGECVNEEKLAQIMEYNKELLEVARPIMQNLHSIVLGTEFVLVLTDRHGYIMETIGEENIKKEASKINFAPGSLWSEEAVGTNAIGTCLVIDKPIQVVGAEHYCVHHHDWTCSAAPIHDDKGNLIGCLDMSGSFYEAHKHTLGIVVAAAYSIENQIALLRSYELIETTIESISDGMIIIDRNYNVNRTNDIAAKILGLKTDEIHQLDIRRVLKDVDIQQKILKQRNPQNYIDCNFYIRHRRIPCSANIAPIITKNEVIGTVIVFKEVKYLHSTVNSVTGNKATYTFDDIITVDKKMKKIIQSAKKISKANCCVLIEGESGTGKELFAHSIHNHSNRTKGPFVAVNCASLPRDLMESELFGYEKGAFTGASKEGKPGKFELADGGTLFLDEIGELPLDLQAKLLRVLDSLTITRIGGKYEKKLDVRVVGATNRNLYEEVKKKNFREDLYYRLNVFKLKIPSLRERINDVEVCVDYFLNRLNNTQNEHKKMDKDFIEHLKNYQWKGNVRELQNIIERAYYLSDEEVITTEYLPDELFYESKHLVDQSNFSIENLEREAIIHALKQSKGHVIEAGKLLDLSKSSIYRKIKKYGIDIHAIND